MVVLKVSLGRRTGPTATVDVDARTSVRDVVILLVYQHPTVLDRSAVPLYRLSLLRAFASDDDDDDSEGSGRSPAGSNFGVRLDNNEAIGSYYVAPASDVLCLHLANDAACAAASAAGAPRELSATTVVFPEEALVPLLARSELIADAPRVALLDALKLTHRPLLGRPVRIRSLAAAEADDAEEDEDTAVLSLASRRGRCGEAVPCNDRAGVALDECLGRTAAERATRQLEATMLPAVRMFVSAPVWRVKVLLWPLRTFKTLVFDEWATADDAALLLWQDAIHNHRVALQGPHSRYGVFSVDVDAGESPESGGQLLDADALLSRVCPDAAGAQWWRMFYVFRAKQQTDVEQAVVPVSGLEAKRTETGQQQQPRDCLCTVLFSDTRRFAQARVSTALSVSDAVASVARSAKFSAALDAGFNFFCLGEDGNSLAMMDPSSPLGDYSGSDAAFSVHCKLRPRLRSLTVVFGVSHTVMVTPPSQSSQTGGVLIFDATLTVRDAVAKMTSSWGLASRCNFLVPEHAALAGAGLKGEYERTLWSYWLRPEDRLSFISGDQSARPSTPDLIPGERVVVSKPDVTRILFGTGKSIGALTVTQYRAVFVDRESGEMTELPLTTICGIDFLQQQLRIVLKDFRVELFAFPTTEGLRDVLRLLKPDASGASAQELVIPQKPLATFAWSNATSFSKMPYGWSTFDALSEFSRMAFNPSEYRITNTNIDFSICETYPRKFIVPFSVSDDDLAKIAQFRARGRVPAVCWVHRNGASITRCAQPLVGFVAARRCAEDEMYIKTLLNLARKADKMYIFDARPNLAAAANTVSGRGGTERDPQAYPNCVLRFCGIGNIHVLKASFEKLAALCVLPPQPGAEDTWLRDLEATGWLGHVQKILQTAALMADTVSRGFPVLTHCSDGWDRTPQLVSLCELLLDPFYRTLKGFAVLVEKEWIAFGHQFADRGGMGCTLGICGIAPVNDKNFSPVFIIFLDCVWQLLQQFPRAFQFNENLLLFLADSMYSSLYGTFLLSSERDRVVNGAFSKTPSVWSFVEEHRADFTSLDHVPVEPPLVPATTLGVIHLWASYYLRYSPKFLQPAEFRSLMM